MISVLETAFEDVIATKIERVHFKDLLYVRLLYSHNSPISCILQKYLENLFFCIIMNQFQVVRTFLEGVQEKSEGDSVLGFSFEGRYSLVMAVKFLVFVFLYLTFCWV